MLPGRGSLVLDCKTNALEHMMQSSYGQQAFQINRVWAKNYRSISDTSADLERFTVFAGPNAAGKSNVLDILRFIKDALRFDLEAAISMRHGIGAIRHHDSLEELANIEIGISASVYSHQADSVLSVDYGFSIASPRDGEYKVSREYGKIWGDSALGQAAEFRIEDGNLAFPESLIPEKPQRPLFGDEDNDEFSTSDLAFPTLLRITRRLAMGGPNENELATPLMYSVLSLLHRNLSNMRFYHIFPNTIREPQKLGSFFPLDEDAGNLASVLRYMDRERPPHMRRLKDSLGRVIPGVSDLEITSAGGYLVVRLKHHLATEETWCDLSLESDGTIRLLALLTALYQHRRPPLVGIEEPELTVHPGALSVLADLLNEASNRSQMIITTHSPDFIDYVTDYRAVENVRIVELVDGVTTVGQVSDTQIEAVRQHLLSPGELHRMGDLQLHSSEQ